MNESSHELQSALRALLAGPRDAHPTPEALSAYHAQTLAAADASRVEAHLLACRDCAGLLLDLAAFPALEMRGARAVSEAEVAAAWQETREKLDLTPATPVSDVVDSAQARAARRPIKQPWLPYAVAATLLLALLPFGMWVAALRRENRELAARATASERRAQTLNEQLAARTHEAVEARQSLALAQQKLSSQEAERRATESATRADAALDSQVAINVPLIELYPDERVRGAEEAGKVIKLPKQVNLFTVTLNIADGEPAANYRLEIVDHRGRSVWAGSGLQKSTENNFTVALPRQLFPPGSYQLNLYRQESAASRAPLARYSLQVVP